MGFNPDTDIFAFALRVMKCKCCFFKQDSKKRKVKMQRDVAENQVNYAKVPLLKSIHTIVLSSLATMRKSTLVNDD